MFGVNPEGWLALHTQERDERARVARATAHPRRPAPVPVRFLPSPAPAAAPVCATC